MFDRKHQSAASIVYLPDFFLSFYIHVLVKHVEFNFGLKHILQQNMES